jgi:hypothetical protein
VIRATVAKYGVASAASFVLTLLVARLAKLLFVSDELAFAVTLVVMTCLNFLACRYWVFGRGDMPVHRQFLSFIAAAAGFRGAEFVLFIVLHTLCGVPYDLAVASLLCVSAVAKFLFFRGYVFRRAPLRSPTTKSLS